MRWVHKTDDEACSKQRLLDDNEESNISEYVAYQCNNSESGPSLAFEVVDPCLP